MAQGITIDGPGSSLTAETSVQIGVLNSNDAGGSIFWLTETGGEDAKLYVGGVGTISVNGTNDNSRITVGDAAASVLLPLGESGVVISDASGVDGGGNLEIYQGSTLGGQATFLDCG